jgi:hypothetical protein
LELDLDGEVAEIASKCLATAVFFSRKSYSPQYLFSDMLKAWGIARLARVDKLGDYNFKLEFTKEEDKAKVLEGETPGGIRVI